MEPGLASIATAQAASRLHRAGREVLDLQSRALPSLQRLGDELFARTSQWWGNGLQMVLLAHLSALGALDFGLVDARSLHVTSAEARQEMFRQQVEDVSTCTEITWTHVSEFLLAADSREFVDAVTGEFIMRARSTHRRVVETASIVEHVRQGLEARRRSVHSDQAAGALQELLAKASAHGAALAEMNALCISAREVQRVAYACADERRAGAGGLNALAGILGNGLLTRLQVLLQPGASASDIEEAIRARDLLAKTLKQAMLQVKRLRGSRELLLERLEEMRHLALRPGEAT